MVRLKELPAVIPSQGEWTEADYLSMHTNRLVELSDGHLEFLPMPTHKHQMIVAFVYGLLKIFVDEHAPGFVLFAPLRVRLWPGKFREPDIMYLGAEHRDRIKEYWEGADLVMEIVSPGKREHDLETKRAEYAKAGIPEYWIVDVVQEQITVLVLAKKSYRVHGEFCRGDIATSKLLPGFAVSVGEVLSA